MKYFLAILLFLLYALTLITAASCYLLYDIITGYEFRLATAEKVYNEKMPKPNKDVIVLPYGSCLYKNPRETILRYKAVCVKKPWEEVIYP